MLAAPMAGLAVEPARAPVLADVTWIEAQALLTPETIVVIPMGAQAKAHGPHLPLSTDYVQAEYFTARVAERHDVVVAPTLTYGFYPPFITFAGSTTVGLSHAKGTIADICRSLARFGPRRFYVLNIGLSTNAALAPAQAELRQDGIVLSYLDLVEAAKAYAGTLQQEKGSHADEVETSIMLHIAPQLVDMGKAVRDYGEQQGAGFWPTAFSPPRHPVYSIYNPSNVYGDATLATAEKGRRFTEALLAAIDDDLAALRAADLPQPAEAATRLAPYLGSYEISMDDRVVVAREDVSLVVQRTGQPPRVLLGAGPDRFEIARTEATFLRDASGNVTHLLLLDDGRQLVARRVEDR